MHVFCKLADEQGVHIQYIDKLSYLGANNERDDNDPLNLNVLLVYPTLNRRQWEKLLECVQRNPQIRFIFFLTGESADDFERGDFGRFPNVELYIEFDEKTERFKQLIKEARG